MNSFAKGTFSSVIRCKLCGKVIEVKKITCYEYRDLDQICTDKQACIKRQKVNI